MVTDRERWDRRHAERPYGDNATPDWLAEIEAELPKTGRALDVAAGTGRISLWLARARLRVTAVDVSPVGLQRLRDAANAEQLTVETIVLNLHESPLPEGPFDVITCFAYLQRDLFPAMQQRVAPGGLLICGMPTMQNLERHSRPPAPFLVHEGELRELCEPLQIVFYREGWFGERAAARVVAKRPPPGE